MPRRAWQVAGAVFALALLGAALWVLRQELREFTAADVAREFLSVRPARLGLSVLCTVAGYLAFGGYDMVAFRWLGIELPFRRVASAAFVGSALANNIPAAFFVGGSVRYRFYARWGVPVAATAALVVINLLTYTLGLLAASAAAFALDPLTLPQLLRLPFGTTRPIAAAATLAVGGYLAWSGLWRRPVRLFRRSLPRPHPRLALAQLAVGLADWGLSGGALYVLLPRGHGLSLPLFFSVFLLGQMAALIAQLPGGLGVFEAVMVAMLAPTVRAPALLGALLAYRVIYFFLPLAAATVVFGRRELQILRARHRRGAEARR
jgi:uncharacterized membrane protein YbhN (UPF0104 family)